MNKTSYVLEQLKAGRKPSNMEGLAWKRPWCSTCRSAVGAVKHLAVQFVVSCITYEDPAQRVKCPRGKEEWGGKYRPMHK